GPPSHTAPEGGTAIRCQWAAFSRTPGVGVQPGPARLPDRRREWPKRPDNRVDPLRNRGFALPSTPDARPEGRVVPVASGLRAVLPQLAWPLIPTGCSPALPPAARPAVARTAPAGQ